MAVTARFPWVNVRRGRERWAFDERILGSGAFVERVLVAAALGVTQMAVLRGVARGRALLQARRLEAERLAREVLKSV